jgi:CDP-paratose 2-epimerase
MKYKNILITGGAGFIGSNLAEYYLKQGLKVIIYDNLSRKGSEKNILWLKSAYPSIKFIQADILDFDKLKRSINQIDILFHFAGQVAVTNSVDNPKKDFDVNALGTLNILEAARTQREAPIIVYASTNKVYGGMDDVDIIEGTKRYSFRKYNNGINESFPLNFHSPYGCSKGAGDQYVRDYARIYGLKTIVFRQSCIYGRRQFGNEDQGWVAHFIRKVLKNKPIIIYGNGKQVRDLLYIDDLISAYLRSLKNIKKSSGQIFNIGGGVKNSVSLLEFLEMMEKKIGAKINISYQNWRPGDQKIYISDNRKAKKTFGWNPTTFVEIGIERLLNWIKTL